MAGQPIRALSSPDPSSLIEPLIHGSAEQLWGDASERKTGRWFGYFTSGEGPDIQSAHPAACEGAVFRLTGAARIAVTVRAGGFHSPPADFGCAVSEGRTRYGVCARVCGGRGGGGGGEFSEARQ